MVLAYLEANGVLEKDLKTNSGLWGNYNNETFDVTKGRYSTDYGASYMQVNGTYTKTASSVLLTTGIVERNSKMNIYDLAGNVSEWTLEKSTEANNPCVFRGGNYSDDGSSYPASYHSYNAIFSSSSGIVFRPALY